MYVLLYTSLFRRKLKKLLRRDRALKARVGEVLELLARNPRSPSLGSHKVADRLGRPAFSSSVTGDLRIIWRYGEVLGALDILDIGGHSGAGKVYR